MAGVFSLWRAFVDLVRERRLRSRTRSDFPSHAKFSKLDWPPTEYVRSAHRARGALLRQGLSSLAAMLKRPDRSESGVAARYEGRKWCDSSERRLNDELAMLHHGQSRALPFLRNDGTEDHFPCERPDGRLPARDG
jgi:hypothetical protein